MQEVPFKQIQQALHEEMLPKFKHVRVLQAPRRGLRSTDYTAW